MQNIIATVRLRLEEAVWRRSGKYVLLMMRKAFKNSSREVHFLVRA